MSTSEIEGRAYQDEATLGSGLSDERSDVTVQRIAADTQQSEKCTPLQDYLNGPDAYRLDAWRFSWGAPPVGQNPDPARAYAQYDNETLDGLIRAGDSLALHERGLSLIWAGLNGRQRAPDGVTLWELGADEYPYSSRIDADALQRGRVLLFEAAVKGRSYDLTRIGLSFLHEKQSRLASGVDEQLLDKLEEQKFAYLMAIKSIVPGLGENYITTSVPAHLENAADAALNDIVNRVIDERKRQGMLPYGTSDDATLLWEPLNICRN